MRVGPFLLTSNVLLAPMAGITDRPFRQLCRRYGAGLVVSEMVTSDRRLWKTEKTRRRLDFEGESEPRSVQIAGADPSAMIEAAKMNVDNGAQIIDINMGCPAKKVCNVAAGSALLKNESLVGKILDSVVNAVDVPVTLKIRTGWDRANQNGCQIARIAEQAGIQALAVHGRTRACLYKGSAEYDTIAEIKSQISIPVIANGDINSAQQAKFVLDYTGADAVMVGRAAQGYPWIFREMNYFLETGMQLSKPGFEEVQNVLCEHLRNLYDFYGEFLGGRIARKHIGWYSHLLPSGQQLKRIVNRAETAEQQFALVTQFFGQLIAEGEKAA